MNLNMTVGSDGVSRLGFGVSRPVFLSLGLGLERLRSRLGLERFRSRFLVSRSFVSSENERLQYLAVCTNFG